MRGLLRIFSVRGLIAAAALVLVVLAIDTGSVVLTKMSSHDDVQQAGYQAAAIAKQGPASRQTAVVALAAAERDAEPHGITVASKGFTIYPDGSVTLTGTKTAPTLLMKHVGAFDRVIHVSTTLTVAPLPFD
ncbi:hypothetical protein ASC77_19235 [Nocardioides sp. Root1257]|uniref:hypothetical protein n=1 Tax=unclassified Nocardioides TaxID=2615069 RepID=UPI0006FAAC4E|nr:MULTISPECIES: hypothetical protein [unclassified Nocardioides]KQW46035.1 hypothetical protein ASC77_19235 [Nocardioides sp. Root1257]KRC43298.1 hypothetical protein ASE24_20200 [Nocardioides sp. Root224]